MLRFPKVGGVAAGAAGFLGGLEWKESNVKTLPRGQFKRSPITGILTRDPRRGMECYNVAAWESDHEDHGYRGVFDRNTIVVRLLSPTVAK